MISKEVTELARAMLAHCADYAEDLTTVIEVETLEKLCNAILAEAEPVPAAIGAWVDLKSSNLKRCRYDPGTFLLTIEFHSGAQWAYAGVPMHKALELMRAESPGKYFNAEIKDKFGELKLEAVGEEGGADDEDEHGGSD